MAQYAGHHKRDESGNVLSRAEETRRHRERHPGQRKQWDATYRNSPAGIRSHNAYNDSDRGQIINFEHHLKKRYGKTLADRENQYHTQGGICTVCFLPLPTDIRKCYWDHNHTTGQMRDLIHGRCNIVVGFVEAGLHNLAVTYLQRHANV